MVEINYFSKYLKYKQKYLKQKNLQIGGGTIKLRITIKNENSKISYENQYFESTKKISDAINEWFKSNKITFTNFSVYRKIFFYKGGSNYEKIQEINNTFDYYTFSDKGEELLIETQQ
jgi:hypothetical protein